MKSVVIFCVLILLTIAIAIVAGHLAFGTQLKPPDPKPALTNAYALPQGWHIVYQMTNNFIPESLVYFQSNQLVYRFGVDFKTNLIGRTMALRQTTANERQ